MTSLELSHVRYFIDASVSSSVRSRVSNHDDGWDIVELSAQSYLSSRTCWMRSLPRHASWCAQRPATLMSACPLRLALHRDSMSMMLLMSSRSLLHSWTMLLSKATMLELKLLRQEAEGKLPLRLLKLANEAN